MNKINRSLVFSFVIIPLLSLAMENTAQFVSKLHAKKYYSCVGADYSRKLASDKDAEPGTLLIYNPNKIAMLEMAGDSPDRTIWWVSQESVLDGAPGPCENGCGIDAGNTNNLSSIPKQWAYVCAPVFKNKFGLPLGGSAQQDEVNQTP